MKGGGCAALLRALLCGAFTAGALSAQTASPTAPCNGLETLTYAGEVYRTVEVGGQCWFAENLRTEHYRNGDPLRAGLRNRAWKRAKTGAVAEYVSEFDEPGSRALHGLLYNGYAVLDPRGLCPVGWRVPSDADWQAFEVAIGGSTNSADALKTPRWDGDNRSGFTATPAGLRASTTGEFVYRGQMTYWWSTTLDPRGLHFRHLAFHFNSFSRSASHLELGLSVRCLKE